MKVFITVRIVTRCRDRFTRDEQGQGSILYEKKTSEYLVYLSTRVSLTNYWYWTNALGGVARRRQKQMEGIPSVLLYPAIGIRFRNAGSERAHLRVVKKIDLAICNPSASI